MSYSMVMKRCYITERLTDKEISSFNDAIDCFFNDAEAETDCILATEIRPTAWEDIWDYLYDLKDYYTEDDDDAEQDS